MRVRLCGLARANVMFQDKSCTLNTRATQVHVRACIYTLSPVIYRYLYIVPIYVVRTCARARVSATACITFLAKDTPRRRRYERRAGEGEGEGTANTLIRKRSLLSPCIVSVGRYLCQIHINMHYTFARRNAAFINARSNMRFLSIRRNHQPVLFITSIIISHSMNKSRHFQQRGPDAEAHPRGGL